MKVIHISDQCFLIGDLGIGLKGQPGACRKEIRLEGGLGHIKAQQYLFRGITQPKETSF